MMFDWLRRQEEDRDERLQALVQRAVREATDEVARKAERRLTEFREVLDLQDEVLRLKKQVEELEITKARKEEDFDRREREIEHKLGLHKKQVEWETDEARRRAKLEVEEEHLEDRQELFEERMEFLTTRFEEEVQYQRKMLEKMLKKLPSAEIFANLGTGRDAED